LTGSLALRYAADRFIHDLFLPAGGNVLGFFIDFGEVVTQVAGNSALLLWRRSF
jgi:hypothetical protein